MPTPPPTSIALSEASCRQIESVLGYRFTDPALLTVALTHSSMSEHGNQSNERLEFLGDAVLGMVVCELLYRSHPELREGEMTKIKSMVVARETCADIARTLGLMKHVILGKGMQAVSNLPASIPACLLESLIGAIYIDGGYEAARAFVRTHFESVARHAAASRHQRNYKSVLQQHAQTALAASPLYRVLDEQGPDHAKCFKVCVEIAGRRFQGCWGATKKRAEQDAARAALRELGVDIDDPQPV